MARTINANLAALLAKDSIETQTTLDLIPAGAAAIRLATDEITVNGNNYTAAIQQADQIQQSINSATNRVRVQIQNVDKSIGLTAAAESLIRAEAVLGRAARDDSVTGAAWEWSELFRGETSVIEIGELTVTIEITETLVAAGFAVANASLAENCQWVFKDSGTCGYIGPLTDCNKKRASEGGCRGRANEHHFGGQEFPEIIVPTAPSGTVPSPTDTTPTRTGCPREDQYVWARGEAKLAGGLTPDDHLLGRDGTYHKIFTLERIENVSIWETVAKNGASIFSSGSHKILQSTGDDTGRAVHAILYREKILTQRTNSKNPKQSETARIRPTGLRGTVIRIELEDGHTYLAGETPELAVWAHNAKPLDQELEFAG